MKNWFTVEQLDGETWAISEYSHWEEPHCYLLAGRDRALLIDSGLGVGDLAAEVRQLTGLPVDVVVTHAHWDHIGGLRQFEHIMVHEQEREWLEGHFPLPLSVVKRNLTCQPCVFPTNFDVEGYTLYQGGAERTLTDGEVLDLGDRQVEILHTPGHSPGHICLYEREREYLFSGDLLYLGCLDAFYPTTDPVAFQSSVERVAQRSVRKIWPGHHSLKVPVDLPKRVEEAFGQLERQGKLVQGAGMFPFDDFSIHI